MFNISFDLLEILESKISPWHNNFTKILFYDSECELRFIQNYLKTISQSNTRLKGGEGGCNRYSGNVQINLETISGVLSLGGMPPEESAGLCRHCPTGLDWLSNLTVGTYMCT